MDMQAYMYKKKTRKLKGFTPPPPMAIFLFRIQEWARE